MLLLGLFVCQLDITQYAVDEFHEILLMVDFETEV